MAAPMRVASAVCRGISFKKSSLTSFSIGKVSRCYSASAAAAPAAQKPDQWQLVSAVCLERYPVITPEQTDFEKKFSSLLKSLEDEYSLLSSHELRHIEDKKIAERKKQEDYEETEEDMARQTTVEIEDAWEEQFNKFTAAARTTEADQKNDTKSHRRKLDRKLVLIVKQKLGDQSVWVLPQGLRQEGESMREAAERSLGSHCGEQLETLFMGNAPCGLYRYKLPQEVREKENTVGAKVFFFKAQLTGGDVSQVGDDIADYKWVTKEELKDYFLPNYLAKVNRFILDL